MSFERLKQAIEKNRLTKKILLATNSKEILKIDSDFAGTLLHWAAVYNRESIITLLKPYFKNLPFDSRGRTPLHWCVFFEAPNALDCLLKNYPEAINLQDGDGYSAIHIAAEENNQQSVKILLDNNAKISLLTDKGKSAFDLARDATIKADLKKYQSQIKEPVYDAPKNHYADKGCVREYIRTKRATVHATAKTKQPAQYLTAHATLVHKSKQGQVKFKHSIADIQNQLRSSIGHMHKSAQGNIIAVDLTFEIRVTNNTGKNERLPINFTLDIPKTGRKILVGSTDDSYSFSDILFDPTEVQKKLYLHGRTISGIKDGDKHGHTPKYDHSGGDDQFIRHSEQTLAVYLCTPEAATMIGNKLIALLRSARPDLSFGSLIKVDSLVLHIHSNKTPCGTCEFTLIGLQNARDKKNGFDLVGLTENLEKYLNEKTLGMANQAPGAYYHFTFPKKLARPEKERGVRFFTVYTADMVDATHPTAPVSAKTKWSDTEESELRIDQVEKAKKLWVGFFGSTMHDKALAEEESDLNQRTIILSGSNDTPETKRTKKLAGKVSEAEFDDLQESLSNLSLLERRQTNK